MNKNRNYIKGIFLILLAGCFIGSEMGYFSDISIWRIFFIFVFTGSFVKSVYHNNPMNSCFSLAALYYVTQPLFALPELSVWVLFISSLLLGLGISCFFPMKKKILKFNDNRTYHYSHTMNDDENIFESDEFEEKTTNDESRVYINIKLGSGEKYLTSKNTQYCQAKCSLGDLRIFFDEANLVNKNPKLQLNVSLGNVVVYIPRNWSVSEQLRVSLSDIEYKGKESLEKTHELTIEGSLAMSNVTLIYV